MQDVPDVHQCAEQAERHGVRLVGEDGHPKQEHEEATCVSLHGLRGHRGCINKGGLDPELHLEPGISDKAWTSERWHLTQQIDLSGNPLVHVGIKGDRITPYPDACEHREIVRGHRHVPYRGEME
ncbi:hypothetical protein CsSME_00039166 [Camellia sinensis var. sinensis]